ncbi:C42S2 protein, partial [Alcedo cyanopectus]|nr:C42S2 protein [Ceyx cyanopectus]
YDAHWLCLFSDSQVVSLSSPQKRRRRIDRSMIGEPTNFVHTAHVGSGDLFSGMNSVS